MNTLGSGFVSIVYIELQVRGEGGSQKEKKRGKRERERGKERGIEKERESERQRSRPVR